MQCCRSLFRVCREGFSLPFLARLLTVIHLSPPTTFRDISCDKSFASFVITKKLVDKTSESYAIECECEEGRGICLIKQGFPA